MTKIDVEIRKASLKDADAIARLMICLGYSTTAEQMRARLVNITQNSAYATFIAIIDEKTIGMTGASLCPLYEADEPAGRIVALCVDPAVRRSRVGSKLVKHAEQWLRNQGVKTILVNSGANRQDAHAFYERLGYSATGVRFKKCF